MTGLAWLATRLDALYGGGIDWSRETGVVHVAAIGAGSRRALAVGPQAPRSRTDRFVLGFARARADVIVTTGAILRAEPGLVHRYADEPEADACWRRFRAEVLGRRNPPTLAVLSGGADLPLDHPALRAANRSILLTRSAGRQRLAEAAGRASGGSIGGGRVAGIEVVALDEPPVEAIPTQPPARADDGAARALARSIAWLRRERGFETVVLESGPRSTLGLYAPGPATGPGSAEGGAASADAPSRLDELLLSIFEGGDFPAVEAPAFPDSAALADHFADVHVGEAGSHAEAGSHGQPVSRCRCAEESGPWVFERYRRPARR